MKMADSKDVSVAVVGGGLVGALQACILAKKGYREVHLYEVTQTKFLSNMGNCKQVIYFGHSYLHKINVSISIYNISIEKTFEKWSMLLEEV